MAERRILLKKTVGNKEKTRFYGAEVEVSGIEHDIEFESELKWAKSEVDNLVAIYNVELKNQKVVSKETYKQDYNNYETRNATSGKVTIDNLTINQGSAKQKDFLVQGINKGFFTLDDVNACSTYEDVSSYVKRFFDMNKKK